LKVTFWLTTDVGDEETIVVTAVAGVTFWVTEAVPVAAVTVKFESPE